MALPVTTIIPFAQLPSCAAQCYPLYDANGACVPPAAATAEASVYDACFCNYAALQPFKTGTAGVCDSACAEPTNLSSVQGWFTSLCADAAATATTSSSTSSATGAGSSSGAQNGGGGSWFDMHMRWVVMIIIVFVGIVGIWVGACIWRRKYLKKKDRMYELGKGLPSSVAVNTQGNLVGAGVEGNNRFSSNQGLFSSGTNAEKSRR